MKQALLLAVLLPFAAAGQMATAVVFPPSSTPATAQALSTHLSGKTFRSTYANGIKVQSRFDADGGLEASAPGFSDAGKWRVEEGKLCGTLQKSGDFCNEARFDAGVLYLRRMNGEVVRYDPEK